MQLYDYLAQIYVFIQNPVRRTGFGLLYYCLPFIVSSAAVLNALLSVVATHRILISGRGNERHKSDLVAAYYHHKVQTIQIVNESLARQPNNITFDVQVAIAILGIVEYTTGSLDNAQKHMAGLQVIMDANGGTIGAPPDHYSALGIVKIANMLISNDQHDHPMNNERRMLDGILTKLPGDCHPSIPSMFHSLKHLSTTMPRNPAVTIAQQSSWLDQLNITELQMHQIIENELISQTDALTTPFVTSRVYPIAGSIFLCLWLRQLSIQSNVLDYLVDSLIYALDEIEHEQQYPSVILLWLLFVGGAAAEGRRTRQWFLGRLSNAVQTLNLDSWRRVKNVLEALPYVDECDEYLRRIWEELERSTIE
ncbi:hypothetical protein TSTA_112060 [Talaromyces stipitatus ATCC 10500]|uniref:C6 transcription factor n=1 Tax=Talaromyces stipitatus (strain ATCC 10500 / CBS 375.48 / QM 6759 / NRRL 1006) TaxID=441959 RepID=B8M975_TALSN|nr:uncharacterized protein TSTA_112060 [Talaromyces stipitatus ATCC 10500]EED17370.1 hypothetical protein TSTA_112060 [Talaromyces stipitatus ATCC 10500]